MKKAAIYGYIVESKEEIFWMERDAKTALKIMQALECFTGDFFGVCPAERRLCVDWRTLGGVGGWKFEERLVKGKVVEIAVVDEDGDKDADDK